MLEQQIKRLSDYRYSIFYKQDLGRLIVDFEPLVKALELSADYALVHWQARPRGQRRWGIFSREAGYQSFQGYQADELACRGFQLDESQALTVPTAVIVYRGVQVLDKGDFAEVVRR